MTSKEICILICKLWEYLKLMGMLRSYMSKVYFGEAGYVQLLKDVLENGVGIPDRTGIGCLAIFDAKVVYDKLENGETDFALSTIRSEEHTSELQSRENLVCR